MLLAIFAIPFVPIRCHSSLFNRNYVDGITTGGRADARQAPLIHRRSRALPEHHRLPAVKRGRYAKLEFWLPTPSPVLVLARLDGGSETLRFDGQNGCPAFFNNTLGRASQQHPGQSRLVSRANNNQIRLFPFRET